MYKYRNNTPPGGYNKSYLYDNNGYKYNLDNNTSLLDRDYDNTNLHSCFRSVDSKRNIESVGHRLNNNTPRKNRFIDEYDGILSYSPKFRYNKSDNLNIGSPYRKNTLLNNSNNEDVINRIKKNIDYKDDLFKLNNDLILKSPNALKDHNYDLLNDKETNFNGFTSNYNNTRPKHFESNFDATDTTWRSGFGEGYTRYGGLDGTSRNSLMETQPRYTHTSSMNNQISGSITPRNRNINGFNINSSSFNKNDRFWSKSSGSMRDISRNTFLDIGDGLNSNLDSNFNRLGNDSTRYSPPYLNNDSMLKDPPYIKSTRDNNSFLSRDLYRDFQFGKDYDDEYNRNFDDADAFKLNSIDRRIDNIRRLQETSILSNIGDVRKKRIIDVDEYTPNRRQLDIDALYERVKKQKLQLLALSYT